MKKTLLDYMEYLNPLVRKRKPFDRYASFHRRMWASSIDLLIVAIATSPLIGQWLNEWFPGPLNEYVALKQILANMILQAVFFTVYSGVCWHYWSNTPGKILLRFKIADQDSGAPMNTRQIILRLVGYWVSILCLGLGFFWISWDKKRQGWHDKLAKTVVLKIPFKRKSEAAHPTDSPAPSTGE